ncbi:MAG: SUMF1/EgtB/PvdO family nonheme iron enzyme [Spirochaetales bacterium]|nr:SUMF1/EgtB/PvdO family nonheme iron enzyme [Spirochaetales bacterium]
MKQKSFFLIIQLIIIAGLVGGCFVSTNIKRKNLDLDLLGGGEQSPCPEPTNKSNNNIPIDEDSKPTTDPEIPIDELYQSAEELNLALIRAVEKKDKEAVIELIKEGADVNTKVGSKEMLLHVAIKNYDEDILVLLFDNGADPDMMNTEGITARYLLGEKKCYELMNKSKIVVPSDRCGEQVIEKTGPVSFAMRLITAGSYYVGENPPQAANVTLTRSYLIGETEVTYELWYEVWKWAAKTRFRMDVKGKEGSNGVEGALPSKKKLEPVVEVPWEICIIWCNALSVKQGLTPVYGFKGPAFDYDADGYRLPTSVEWEIAARGAFNAIRSDTYGYSFSGSNNLDEVGWFSDNSGDTTHFVGMKAANQVGVYDMTGNVDEWCWDFPYHVYPSSDIDPTGENSGAFKVCRGGGFCDKVEGDIMVIGHEICTSPNYGYDSVGFRLARNY